MLRHWSQLSLICQLTSEDIKQHNRTPKLLRGLSYNSFLLQRPRDQAGVPSIFNTSLQTLVKLTGTGRGAGREGKGGGGGEGKGVCVDGNSYRQALKPKVCRSLVHTTD